MLMRFPRCLTGPVAACTQLLTTPELRPDGFHPRTRICRTFQSALNWVGKFEPRSLLLQVVCCWRRTIRKSSYGCWHTFRKTRCCSKHSVAETTFTRSLRLKCSECLR